MTSEQLNNIVKLLKIWRTERKLTRKEQRLGLIDNLIEEMIEYNNAKDDYERIDALCDICVFCLNAYNPNEPLILKNHIIRFFSIKQGIEGIKRHEDKANHSSELVAWCFNKMIMLGYLPYECMLETIHEISSRIGEFNPRNNKWIKFKGAYDINDIKLAEGEMASEADKYFIISDKYGNSEKLVKWYKANYARCKRKPL